MDACHQFPLNSEGNDSLTLKQKPWFAIPPVNLCHIISAGHGFTWQSVTNCDFKERFTLECGWTKARRQDFLFNFGRRCQHFTTTAFGVRGQSCSKSPVARGRTLDIGRDQAERRLAAVLPRSCVNLAQGKENPNYNWSTLRPTTACCACSDVFEFMSKPLCVALWTVRALRRI